MGFLGILKGIGKGIGMASGLGAIGSGMSASSQQAANNRGAKFAGQMDLATLLAQRDIENARLAAQADNDFVTNTIKREQEGRDGRSAAWKGLLSAQRMINPGAMPNVSPYAAAQRQATGAERQGADALTAEVMARLAGGNPMAQVERRAPGLQFDPTGMVDLNLLNAGKGERAGNWLGAIFSGVGGGRG